MAAVQTAIKPAQKTSVGAETFTGIQSKQYIKQMTGVNVSTIAFMRGFFPEQAFEDKKMKNLNLKILRKNVHPGADRLISWLVGVNDAIEKEFLESVTIAIVNDLQKPTEVSESYTFTFDYHSGYNISFNSSMATSTSAGGGDDSKDVPTIPQVKMSTTKMLRHLVKLTALQKKLSNNVFSTMRLTYNESRPSDYLPPGFIHETEEYELADITESIKFRVGGFHTGMDGMQLQVKINKNAINSGNEENSNPITPSQAFGKSSLRDRSLNSTGGEMDQSALEEESPGQSEGSRDTTMDEAKQLPPITGLSQEEVTNEGEEEVESSQETSMEQDSVVVPAANKRIKTKPSPIEKDGPDVTSQTSSFGTASDDDDGPTQESTTSKQDKVRCPCLDEVEEGLMLTCEVCGYQQHAICFCLPNDSTPPKQHVCNSCCNATRPCTDPRLAGMKSNQIQFLCIWRRTLQAYQGTSCQITTNELMTKFNCTKYCAAKVIAKMTKDGLVETYKNKKMIQRQPITETFTREIRHVAQNLKRQRGEVCTGSQSKSKRSLSCLKGSISNNNSSVDNVFSKPKVRKMTNQTKSSATNNNSSAYNFDTTDEMDVTITSNNDQQNSSFVGGKSIWNNKKPLKMGASGNNVKRKPLTTSNQQYQHNDANVSQSSSVSEFKTDSIWKKAAKKGKSGKKRSLEPYNAMLASQSSVFDYEAGKEDERRRKMRR